MLFNRGRTISAATMRTRSLGCNIPKMHQRLGLPSGPLTGFKRVLRGKKGGKGGKKERQKRNK